MKEVLDVVLVITGSITVIPVAIKSWRDLPISNSDLLNAMLGFFLIISGRM